jgi:hypothetical protein
MPVHIIVKLRYAFTTASTACFLRDLRALPTFSCLTALVLSRPARRPIPARVVVNALLALDRVSTITFLYLDGNKMKTPRARQVLCGFVAQQKDLWSLSLSETGVGASLRAFCSAISGQTKTGKMSLKSAEVDLTQGRTAAPATSALAQGAWFSSVFGNLRMLDLSGNNLASQMGDLLPVLVGLTELRQLRLADADLRDDDGQFLLDMLAGSAVDGHEFAQEFSTACPALKLLDVSSNGLHTLSFNALKELLSVRPNLEYVHMESNKICAQGTILLINFISSGRVTWSMTTIVIKEQMSSGTAFNASYAVFHGLLFGWVAQKYHEMSPDPRPKTFFCNGQQVRDTDIVGMRPGVLGYGRNLEVIAMPAMFGV